MRGCRVKQNTRKVVWRTVFADIFAYRGDEAVGATYRSVSAESVERKRELGSASASCYGRRSIIAFDGVGNRDAGL